MSPTKHTESDGFVLVFIARKPGLTFQEFKDYYENNHSPLVGKLCLQGEHAPLSITRHYIERGDGSEATRSFPFGGAQLFDYDCITRVRYRSQKHRETGMAEFAKYREEVGQDEAKFIDLEKFRIVFVADAVSEVWN